MNFFESFASLGYSAINLVIILTVILAIIFRVLKLHLKPARTQIIGLILLMAVAAVPFAMSVNFLAKENQRLNDAIRDEGGLKRNIPKN